MTVKRRIKLDLIKIASPCPASWEEMLGDEQVRFCNICSKHVYNLSAMARAEAQLLVHRSRGRICARIYMRADGTIMTTDCPVGLARLRKTIAKRIAAVAAVVVGLISGAASLVLDNFANERMETAFNCRKPGIYRTGQSIGGQEKVVVIRMGRMIAR